MNEKKEKELNEPYVMKNQSTYKEYTGKKSLSNKIAIALAIIASSVVVVFLAIGMIKSHNRAQYKDEFYVQQEVTRYLQERYNEEFIVYYERGMGGAYNYVQLYAYPIAQQDDAHEIKIQGYYNKWGKMDFYDDYVMVRLTEEYEAYIDPIIDEYFDEYKFYIDFYSEWLTNNLPTDIQLEDLWSMQANVDYPLPEIFLYLKSSESLNYNQGIRTQVAENLQKNNYRGMLSMTIYYDDAFFVKRNRSNVYKDVGARGDSVKGVSVFIYDNEIKEYE